VRSLISSIRNKVKAAIIAIGLVTVTGILVIIIPVLAFIVIIAIAVWIAYMVIKDDIEAKEKRGES